MKPCPLRKLSIALGLIGAAFLVAATVCLAYVQWEYILYACLGGAGLGALLVLLSLLCAIGYKKVNQRASKRVLAKIQAIREGDLSPETYGGRCSEEIIEIAKAINELPNASVDFQTSSNEVLEGEEFQKKFDILLRSVLSSRSALLVFGFTDKALPQSYDKLKAYLREGYPNTLMGRVKGGFAIYLPYVTSADAIEGKVKVMISGFVHAENASSMKPIALGLKAVVAFYPDLAREEIFDDAIGELDNANPILVLKTGEAHVEPSTVSGRAILDGLPYEKYRMAMSQAKEAKDRRKALRLLMASVGFATGYEAIGLAYYDASRKSYRLIEELHREGMAPAFKSLAKEDFIKEDRLDPYYKLAVHERFFASNDGLHLPSRPAGIMDSLGLRSIAVRAIGTDEEKEGIIYLTSTKAMPECTYQQQEALVDFFDALSIHLLLEKGIAEREEAKKREELLTGPFRHFMLQIDPITMAVLHASENLASAFPELEVGKPCPTSILPKDVDILSAEGFRKTLPPLGPGIVHYQAISRAPNLTLILTKQEQNLSSFRMDKGLFILNRRALMADLETDFLSDKEGIVLAFRIENADAVVSRFENSTIDEVMAAVLSRLSVSALEEGLYRYDPNTLAYLISGGEKEDGRELAVQLAEALSSPIPFLGKDFQPEISYYVISYPTEASCNFDLESLLRTSFARVAAVGKGRIVPFDDKDEAPLVLPRAYKEETLKKALAKGKFPLAYSPILENSSMRPRYVEVGAGLPLSKDEKPTPQAVRALIHDEKTTSQLEVGEAQSFFEFYKAHSDVLKGSSIKGAILRASKCSLFSSTYIRALSRGIKDAKLPKGYLALLVPNAFTEEEAEKKAEFEKNMESMHIRLVYELGGEEKGNLLYLPQDAIELATSSVAKAEELGREVAKAKEANINLVLPSLTRQEQRSYAIALGIPYGEGPLYGEHLNEEEFLEALKD